MVKESYMLGLRVLGNYILFSGRYGKLYLIGFIGNFFIGERVDSCELCNLVDF